MWVFLGKKPFLTPWLKVYGAGATLGSWAKLLVASDPGPAGSSGLEGMVCRVGDWVPLRSVEANILVSLSCLALLSPCPEEISYMSHLTSKSAFCLFLPQIIYEVTEKGWLLGTGTVRDAAGGPPLSLLWRLSISQPHPA